MPKKSKVRVISVSSEEEYSDSDSDYIDSDDSDSDSDSDDSNSDDSDVSDDNDSNSNSNRDYKEYKTRSKENLSNEKYQEKYSEKYQEKYSEKYPLKKNLSKEKIPISKRFLINKGNPITDLKSLICAFEHPDADNNQKELIECLKKLDNMIGMGKFKEQLINQILYFIQDMHDSQTFLHTVITGPPGVGKTYIINLLAKIYSCLGILETDKIVKADRASMIGNWLGTTSIKTKQVLDSAKGGVLILDEVYSLGNKEHSDTYSKECIDTLNQYLSEHVNEFICVIAGYKDLVQECFFNSNPGLERRFPWKFDIEPYTPDELTQIFNIQLSSNGWKLDKNIPKNYINKLINSNKKYFTGNGGDTKNLIDKCKIINARRVFTQISDNRHKKSKMEHTNEKTLTEEDVNKGFTSFLESKTTN